MHMVLFLGADSTSSRTLTNEPTVKSTVALDVTDAGGIVRPSPFDLLIAIF